MSVTVVSTKPSLAQPPVSSLYDAIDRAPQISAPGHEQGPSNPLRRVGRGALPPASAFQAARVSPKPRAASRPAPTRTWSPSVAPPAVQRRSVQRLPPVKNPASNAQNQAPNTQDHALDVLDTPRGAAENDGPPTRQPQTIESYPTYQELVSGVGAGRTSRQIPAMAVSSKAPGALTMPGFRIARKPDSGARQAVDTNLASTPHQRIVEPPSEQRANDTPGSKPNSRLAPAITPPVPGNVAHGPYAHVLKHYRGRINESIEATQDRMIDRFVDDPNDQVNQVDTMWWKQSLSHSLGFSPQVMAVDIGSLTQTALASSPFVRSILTEPKIRQHDIVEADAEFDPTVFLESKFTDTSEPVGSQLTTGDNSDRFRDETFTSVGGLRKKTRKGGRLEVFQRAGFQANNSQFLDPNPQGTTRLEFNFTQPLMRDRGHAVNNTRLLLAKLDLQVTNASVRQELEDHLIDVARAYWDLYLARADWLQRKRLLDGAEYLHRILEARDTVDSQRRQILRARAALTSRRSDLVRASTRIRDIQSQLRLLTGSRQLIDAQQWELAPQDHPLEFPVDVSVQQSIAAALDNRSDIAQAIRNVQAVSARVGAARNQVLPRLDLILGTYVAGLKDERNAIGAWVNQFDKGRPTYWAGLTYELPIGNRASRARLNRNRLELAQSMHDFQQATEVAFTEVEVAVRETKTAYNEMVTKQHSVQAASNEVSYLQQRWEYMPDPNESAVLLIEDLLDAQQRLADEEHALVSAQVAYALSWIQLRKVTGVLLQFNSAANNKIVVKEEVAGEQNTASETAEPSSTASASEDSAWSDKPDEEEFDPMWIENPNPSDETINTTAPQVSVNSTETKLSDPKSAIENPEVSQPAKIAPVDTSKTPAAKSPEAPAAKKPNVRTKAGLLNPPVKNPVGLNAPAAQKASRASIDFPPPVQTARRFIVQPEHLVHPGTKSAPAGTIVQPEKTPGPVNRSAQARSVDKPRPTPIAPIRNPPTASEPAAPGGMVLPNVPNVLMNGNARSFLR